MLDSHSRRKTRRQPRLTRPDEASSRHHRLRLLLIRLLLLRLLLGLEAADREVVNHLFHLLQVVLEAVEALAQVVVLEVKEPEPGAEFAEELRHSERPQVVSGSDAVHDEPRLRQMGTRLFSRQKYSVGEVQMIAGGSHLNTGQTFLKKTIAGNLISGAVANSEFKEDEGHYDIYRRMNEW